MGYRYRIIASPIESATMELKGDAPKVSGSITLVTETIKFKTCELDRRWISFSIENEKIGIDGVLQFSGMIVNDSVSGYGTSPTGESFTWKAVKREEKTDEKKEEEEDKKKESDKESDKKWEPIGRLVYPPSAYGREGHPEQIDSILVKNAMIWTCGPQGILKNADLLIEQGKVKKVAQNIEAPDGTLIIDAEGKHVTPGIHDCHQHTAIDHGVNETGQEITAETRIKDVINSYDIGIYRELAGGVTTAHTMHGSANPIGGQCATYKLKWGAKPSELIFDKAPVNLKLALGENPKRVWQNAYPRTRMGVEQIIRDRFLAALDYQQAWKDYRESNRFETIPPRRDLELDAILAVLKGESRMFTHAYRQDEMLMILRLAEEFDMHPGNFQHGLEGYKIASEIAEAGAQVTSFSDWWAYKFEVYDSIAYNGALLYDAGVLTTFNSDDNELSRRLNTEAAKAVKYGGVPDEEALKFVTINTAKQLQIDKYTGSLEPGKDGDFVIWSGDPLSTFTRCEQTWIEGCKYFDYKEDREIADAVEKERAELIQRILSDEKKDDDKKKNNDSDKQE
jgi:imidazolonepropionase-like amidohydrolase